MRLNSVSKDVAPAIGEKKLADHGIVGMEQNTIEGHLDLLRDKILLLCYHYDPTTGKYGAATINAIRVGFIATVAGFLSFLFVSLRRERAEALANRT